MVGSDMENIELLK